MTSSSTSSTSTSVERLLSDLVAMPTQQGTGADEHAMCTHLATLLAPLHPDEIVVERAARSDGSPGAYVFARWGTPTRVINAHVDTVPANAGWTTPPWTPRIADGRLYGLGSADTKGAIAATLVALESLGHAPRDRGVLFSGDEEAGSHVCRAFLASPHRAGIREMIVCEPSSRRAGVAHRGVLGQTATLDGPGGHSSKADHLPKPIARLARLATRLDDLAIRRVGQGPTGMTGTCMNLSALRGGIAYNVIAAHAQLEWSLRPYPGFDRDDWEREIAALAREVDPAIVIATMTDLPPFGCAALADVVRPFVREIGTLDYWTEAALYEAAGIDAIVVGPGDIAQAHAADEWVALDDLAWAVELYRALLA
ncbi:MAG: M20/M25/M40 family metallo-hydrolase [Proteobacteria bacterium]|nr:M20/M25/M40 family metallo-hydrolase [Pseudomonadota bacterium]